MMCQAGTPVPRCASHCHAISPISYRSFCTEHTEDHDKAAYVNVIVDTIISTGRADDFIVAIANVIQRLAIDQLHLILGDIHIADQEHTSFSTRCATIIAGIFNGATTTYSGWEPQPAMMPVSAMSSDCRCATPTSPPWRRVTASTSFHWQPLRWIPTAMILAKNSCQR